MEKYTKEMKGMCLDIEAKIMVSIMNSKDAQEFGIMPLSRAEIYCPTTKKAITTVVDVTDTMVRKGEIGLYKDVTKMLKMKVCQNVEVKIVGRPKSVAAIKKKLDGEKLNEKELTQIVEDISNNALSNIETSAFMAAVYINGFDLDETVAMTKALIADGKNLELDKEPVLDKHSIGGTNGRVTMIVAPIVAARGYYMPKTSSRAITSSAGTADSMEVLCNVTLSLEEMKNITEKVGAVVAWGGAVDLAPADDKIIKVEHPLSLDPPGQVIASVMAKKASVGAKFLVIDLPIGPDVKVKTRDKAEEMALKFLEVGKSLGMKVEVVITNGTEPFGRAFGPALEAKYVYETLEGKINDNLAQKSCELAGALFELVGAAKKGKGFDMARQTLKSGKALKKFREMVKAQGGKIMGSEGVHLAKYKKAVDSTVDGEISKINVKMLNHIARVAGAPADKKSGLMLNVEEGQRVHRGDILFEIYAENKRKLDLAVEYAKTQPVIELEKMILERYV